MTQLSEIYNARILDLAANIDGHAARRRRGLRRLIQDLATGGVFPSVPAVVGVAGTLEQAAVLEGAGGDVDDLDALAGQLGAHARTDVEGGGAPRGLGPGLGLVQDAPARAGDEKSNVRATLGLRGPEWRYSDLRQ